MKTMKQWFEKNDVDFNSALFVNIATDGLNPDRNKLFCISVASNEISEPQLFYIRYNFEDVDIEGSEQYTGISRETYRENFAFLPETISEVKPYFDNAGFCVSYNVDDFLLPWLNTVYKPEDDLEWLDIVSVIKLYDRKGHLDMSAQTLAELNKTIKNQTAFLSNSGYSINALAYRFLGIKDFPEDISITESKIYVLRMLYNHILDLRFN